MPVNEPDDVVVAGRELHGSNGARAFEPGKSGFHRGTMTELEETEKTW